MLSHQAYLIEQFQQASKNDGATSQRPEHLGTSRTLFGLKNAIRRDIIYKWIKQFNFFRHSKIFPIVIHMYVAIF